MIENSKYLFESIKYTREYKRKQSVKKVRRIDTVRFAQMQNEWERFSNKMSEKLNRPLIDTCIYRSSEFREKREQYIINKQIDMYSLRRLTQNQMEWHGK